MKSNLRHTNLKLARRAAYNSSDDKPYHQQPETRLRGIYERERGIIEIDMELKEFIKTAITDITNAVSDLQKDLTNGAIVNPTLPTPIALKTLVVDNEIRPIEQLSFDVAVTASEETGIDGQAKAGISIFGAKVGSATSAKTENVSRISFVIPVVFPSAHVKTPREIMKEHRPQRPTYDQEDNA